jgi:hypothetical protein
MNIYSNPTTISSPQIDGRGWAALLMKAPVLERAYLAACWCAGLLMLEQPTLAQAATLSRTTNYFVKLWLTILDRPDAVRAVLDRDLTLSEAFQQREMFQRVPQPPAPPVAKTSILDLSSAMGVDAMIATIDDETLARLLNPRLDRILEHATAPHV